MMLFTVQNTVPQLWW